MRDQDRSGWWFTQPATPTEARRGWPASASLEGSKNRPDFVTLYAFLAHSCRTGIRAVRAADVVRIQEVLRAAARERTSLGRKMRTSAPTVAATFTRLDGILVGGATLELQHLYDDDRNSNGPGSQVFTYVR